MLNDLVLRMYQNPDKKIKNKHNTYSIIYKTMKIGLRLPQTGKDNANRENIVLLAKEAENASLDSLWVLERLVWINSFTLS